MKLFLFFLIKRKKDIKLNLPGYTSDIDNNKEHHAATKTATAQLSVISNINNNKQPTKKPRAHLPHSMQPKSTVHPSHNMHPKPRVQLTRRIHLPHSALKPAVHLPQSSDLSYLQTRLHTSFTPASLTFILSFSAWSHTLGFVQLFRGLDGSVGIQLGLLHLKTGTILCLQGRVQTSVQTPGTAPTHTMVTHLAGHSPWQNARFQECSVAWLRIYAIFIRAVLFHRNSCDPYIMCENEHLEQPKPESDFETTI